MNSKYVLIAFNDAEQTTLVGQPTIGQQATIKEEIIDLFNFFHEKKVFIIDRPIIKELYDILEEYNNRIVNDVTGLLDHNKINKIESQKYLLKKINNFSTAFENEKIHINFGICMMDFETFYTVSDNWNRLLHVFYKLLQFKHDIQELKEKDIHCNITLKTNNHEGHTVLSNLYIICDLLTIQVSIVYDRSDFFWILKDDETNGGTQLAKGFGDEARALHK